MKSWFIDYKEHVKYCSSKFCAFLTVLLCFAIISCAIFIFAKPHVSKVYKSYVVAELNEATSEEDLFGLNEQDKVNINDLIAKNKIIPISTVYEDTLEYYDTLIMILVGLLAFFTIVSLVSINGKVKELVNDSMKSKKIEHTISKIVKRKVYGIVEEIVKKESFRKSMEPVIKKHMDLNLSDYVAEAVDDNPVIKELITKETEIQVNKYMDASGANNKPIAVPKPVTMKKDNTKDKRRK